MADPSRVAEPRGGAVSPALVPACAQLDDGVAAADTVAALADVVVSWLEDHGFALPSLYLEQSGRLRCTAVRGYWQVLDGLGLDTGVLATVCRTGEPQHIQDVRLHPGYIAALNGVVAELCLPLRYGGRVIGALNVESERRLAPDDIALVEAAAAAFEARLRALGGPEPESAWQRLARRSAALAELTEVDDIAAFAVRTACELTGFDSAVLVVPAEEHYHVLSACGPMEGMLRALPHAALPGIAGWTDSATAVYTSGAIAGTGFDGHEALRNVDVRALACVALPSKHDRHGFLLVVARHEAEIDHAAIQHLEILAAHTMSSLHTAAAVDALRNKAAQDSLTGLGHSATFHADLSARLSSARQHTAVLLIDLDNFKNINDTQGHGVGDRVLVATADVLKRALRGSDRLYRIGGDEFAAIAAVRSADEAQGLADRVNQAARRAGPARVSLGVTLVPPGEIRSSDDVLAEADLALYETKARGRDGATVYTPGLRAAVRERARLAADLVGAVDRGEFRLEYQPVVDLGGAGVLGLEALVRWQHPEHGVIPPLDFIPLAEQGGLIVDIGAWVLDEACRQLAVWRDQDWCRRDLRMAVNVSAAELGGDYVDAVVAVLDRHDIAPGSLVIEVTESVFIDESGAADQLERVRGLGVHVAVDDFGTGYSSLSYLHRLPIDILKIDRAFLAELNDPTTFAVAEAIVQLSATLKLSTVAEGVEHQQQVDHLRRLGCEHAQGYLWSPPVPADEVAVVCRAIADETVTITLT